MSTTESSSEKESSFGYRQVLPVLSGSFEDFFQTNYYAKQPGIFANLLKQKFKGGWTFEFKDYEPPVLLEATLLSESFFKEFKEIRNYMIRPPPKKMFTMERGGEVVLLTEKFIVHLKDGDKDNKKHMVVAFIGENAENTSYNIVRANCLKDEFNKFEIGAKGHYSYILKNRKSIPEDDPLKRDVMVMTRQIVSTISLESLGSDFPFVIYIPEKTKKVRVCFFTKEELKKLNESTNNEGETEIERNKREEIRESIKEKYKKAISHDKYNEVSFEVDVIPETKYFDTLYESKTPTDSLARLFLRRHLGKDETSSVMLSEVEKHNTDGFFEADPLQYLSELLYQLYQVPIWQYRPKSMLSQKNNDKTGVSGALNWTGEKMKAGLSALTGSSENSSSKYWFADSRGKYNGTLKNTEHLTVSKEYLDTFGKKAFIDKTSKFGNQEKEENFILVSRYVPGEQSRYMVRLILAFTGKRVTTVRQVRSKYGLEYIKRSSTNPSDSTHGNIVKIFTEHFLKDRVHLDSESPSRVGTLTPSSIRHLVNTLLKAESNGNTGNPLIDFSLEWELNFNRFHLRQNLLIPNAYLVSLLPEQSEEEEYAMMNEIFTYSLFVKVKKPLEEEGNMSISSSLTSDKLKQLLDKDQRVVWKTKRGETLSNDEFDLLKAQLKQHRFLAYTGIVSNENDWKLVLYVASSLERAEKMPKMASIPIKDSDYVDFLTYRKHLETLETSTATIPIRTFSFNLYDPKLYVFFAYKKLKDAKKLIDLMSFGNNVFRKTDKEVSLKLITFSVYQLLSNEYLSTHIYLLRSPYHSDLFLFGGEKNKAENSYSCTFAKKLVKGKTWDSWNQDEFTTFLGMTTLLGGNWKGECPYKSPSQIQSTGLLFSTHDMNILNVVFKKNKENEKIYKLETVPEILKTALEVFKYGSSFSIDDEYELLTKEEKEGGFFFQSKKFAFETYVQEGRDVISGDMKVYISVITDIQKVTEVVEQVSDDLEMQSPYSQGGKHKKSKKRNRNRKFSTYRNRPSPRRFSTIKRKSHINTTSTKKY